jgi:hypothetical protein
MNVWKWSIGAAGLLAVAVFVAGFFYSADQGPRLAVTAPEPEQQAFLEGRADDAIGAPVPAMPSGRRGAVPVDRKVESSRVSDPANNLPQTQYARNARMSVEVEDTIAAFEGIEKRAQELGGELVSVNLQGNDEGRQGPVSLEVPTERFNDLVTDSRGLGKVLNEVITAQRQQRPTAFNPWNTQNAQPSVQVAQVTLTLRDQKIAPEVSRGQGILSGSFARSAEHCLKGLAVMIEGVGYVLPFIILLMALFAGIRGAQWARRRSRRATATA